MTGGERLRSLEARHLRTRFSPKSRIGQGIVSMAPWIDIILLVIVYLLLDSRIVLQPGIVVDTPAASFTEGTRSGRIAVILPVGGAEGGGKPEDVVFFDDERFLIHDERQHEGLKQAFRSSVERHPDRPLVIQADRSVPHGTVQEVVHMALDVGFTKVNVATKPF